MDLVDYEWFILNGSSHQHYHGYKRKAMPPNIFTEAFESTFLQQSG